MRRERGEKNVRARQTAQKRYLQRGRGKDKDRERTEGEREERNQNSKRREAEILKEQMCIKIDVYTLPFKGLESVFSIM